MHEKLPLPRPAAWRLGAACRGADPELFFPEGSGWRTAEEERAAKQVCTRCVVRRVCLTWALIVPETEGIWGGTTPAERRALHVDVLASSPTGTCSMRH